MEFRSDCRSCLLKAMFPPQVELAQHSAPCWQAGLQRSITALGESQASKAGGDPYRPPSRHFRLTYAGQGRGHRKWDRQARLPSQKLWVCAYSRKSLRVRGVAWVRGAHWPSVSRFPLASRRLRRRRNTNTPRPLPAETVAAAGVCCAAGGVGRREAVVGTHGVVAWAATVRGGVCEARGPAALW